MSLLRVAVLVLAFLQVKACTPGNNHVLQGGRVTYIFYTSAVNRACAVSTCRGVHGGELASIHSEQETSFIVETFRDKGQQGDVWIGLEAEYTCNQCSGGATSPGCDQCRRSWYWVDETRMSYNGWSDTEPNGDDTCGKMNSTGHWIDTNCEMSHVFVCKTNGYIADFPESPDVPTPQVVPTPTAGSPTPSVPSGSSSTTVSTTPNADGPAANTAAPITVTSTALNAPPTTATPAVIAADTTASEDEKDHTTSDVTLNGTEPQASQAAPVATDKPGGDDSLLVTVAIVGGSIVFALVVIIVVIACIIRRSGKKLPPTKTAVEANGGSEDDIYNIIPDDQVFRDSGYLVPTNTTETSNSGYLYPVSTPEKDADGYLVLQKGGVGPISTPGLESNYLTQSQRVDKAYVNEVSDEQKDSDYLQPVNTVENAGTPLQPVNEVENVDTASGGYLQSQCCSTGSVSTDRGSSARHGSPRGEPQHGTARHETTHAPTRDQQPRTSKRDEVKHTTVRDVTTAMNETNRRLPSPASTSVPQNNTRQNSFLLTEDGYQKCMCCEAKNRDARNMTSTISRSVDADGYTCPVCCQNLRQL